MIFVAFRSFLDKVSIFLPRRPALPSATLRPSAANFLEQHNLPLLSQVCLVHANALQSPNWATIKPESSCALIADTLFVLNSLPDLGLVKHVTH